MKSYHRLVTSFARIGMWVILAALVTSSAFGQMQVGDNTSMNLSGSLGFGYGGGWGDNIPSSHSTTVNGLGILNGYYYDPNFLSFNVQPYYNRSQSNASSQSLLTGSGVSSTVNLFTGSHIPGSVFFSKDYSSGGQYGLPGVGALTTDGSSQTYGFTWSALFPDWPTLTTSYSSRSTSSSVLGTVGDFKNSTKDFNLNSTYSIFGYQWNAFYAHRNFSAEIPDFLGGLNLNNISSNAYGLSVTRRLPLSGSFGAGYSRTTYSGVRSNADNGNVTDNANAGVTITPWKHLTLSTDLRYTNNVIALAEQQYFPPGSGTPVIIDSAEAKSVVSTNNAYMGLGHGFMVVGNITHREQWYDHTSYADTQYGATLNYRYAKPLFGLLYFNFGVIDTANKRGNSSLGFNSGVGLTRKKGPWDISADFLYTHNVQTLVSVYSLSTYNYGGYVRRRLNSRTYWHAAARAAHSALVQHEGDGNRTETFTSGLTWRRYGFTGTYSQSKGASVLTTTGELTPSPIGSIFTNEIVMFNGRSYTLSLSSTPIRRMILTAYYSKLNSDTTSLLNSINSINNGDRFDMRFEYRLRKLSLIGDYTRTNQVITAAEPNGITVNAYQFTISRWFNVF
ncbi:MAG TPA: hypothetical protein VF135_06450 [Terriglobales bacterium]